MAESVLRPKLANFFDTIAGYASKDWNFEEAVIPDTSPMGEAESKVLEYRTGTRDIYPCG
jgi:hypothetical protein